eukprot:TRINITY_DN27593_c0_g2_i12.p11 TRINITY_DN27593_c0_g2~~TRINITY_DN27593_c0_g2_i12.p11  ORF type:complete len:143 (-),score=4.35 TRINITY_DN27593_c0_g2_i12:1159-1587(-)
MFSDLLELFYSIILAEKNMFWSFKQRLFQDDILMGIQWVLLLLHIFFFFFFFLKTQNFDKVTRDVKPPQNSPQELLQQASVSVYTYVIYIQSQITQTHSIVFLLIIQKSIYSPIDKTNFQFLFLINLTNSLTQKIYAIQTKT